MLVNINYAFETKATLAARKTQKLLDTASALFVITQEDIRRAGITNIADALRLAPGMQVARLYANRWAISARYLNGLYSSKLLVMIDERTIYNPLNTSWFYNDYDKLRTTEVIGFQPLPPALIAQWDNQMSGEVYRLKMAAQRQVSKDWRLMATYSYTDVQLHLLPSSQAIAFQVEEGDTPHNQATRRSLLNLPHNMEFDTALYYVDNISNQNTPNYTRFDVRLGWQPKKYFRLGARNLFDSQLPEFGNGFEGNVEISP